MVVQNTSVLHNVPAMIQPQTWACWYTAFQMVVTYERARNRASPLKDPSEVPWVKAIFDANKGIGATSDEREKVAKALGFETLYASVSEEGLWRMITAVPVVYAGHWPGKTFGHFIVIVGISGGRIYINNPASGMEDYDYGWFSSEYLLQSAERPLCFPPY